MNLTRRRLLHAAGLAAASPAFHVLGILPNPAASLEDGWRHGLSLFGDLLYPPGFAHFEYVDPNAPKGGSARQSAPGMFDNFNPVVAGLKGALAVGVDFVLETLTVPALDEVTSEYGLLAEAVKVPPDFSHVVYRLRSAARWHDGNPVTAEDVIFSFEAFKTYDPRRATNFRSVVRVEKGGEREVTFTFDRPGNRELPQSVGQLPVLAKHWWEGTDRHGNKRDVSRTTMEPPLGSGPYRVKDFAPGRSIVYERVKDHWGRDLPVNIGHYNFDELRFEYFRDPLASREAFKADHVDWRVENSAKDWATAYDFPAVREKRVLLEEFPIRNVGIMQAFVLNGRRDKFKDPRVRHAFNLALDFEEMNKQMFFGQYHRIPSYFDGTELASSGLPKGKELEILATVRDKVPAEAFTQPYRNPVGGNTDAVRSNLREAARLFREAGYEVRDTRLVNARTGEPFTVEILVDDPTFERLALFYQPALERLGIDVAVRRVDDVQYQNRLRQRDYDIIKYLWGEPLSPGNEQRDYWGSEAADTPGSPNYAGIKSPAVDALIDRVIFARDREELVAATRALDRVLLWNYYVVPQFTYGKVRTARWDRFGRPGILPKYGLSGFPSIWWWDAERAAKLGSR